MTPFQIQSLSPLWIPDLPTPSLILYLFRLSTSLHMAFHLSNFDSLMEPPILSSHRLWTCKSAFLPGNLLNPTTPSGSSPLDDQSPRFRYGPSRQLPTLTNNHQPYPSV